MRMAERTGEPGSTLLVHEFFEVIVKVDGRAEEAQVYQALGFAENGGVIMVQGLYYAPARVVLGYRPLRGNAHTYDAENASSDADIQLREGAPELVLIRNCTAWFEMGSLTDGKPMVVHPLEIKERRIVVAGKAQHYVCGSQAREEAAAGSASRPCRYTTRRLDHIRMEWGASIWPLAPRKSLGKCTIP